MLAIPAQHPGLTCSRKRTLFASTVFAAVITVTAKYLSFVGGQGWLATPPLFDFSVYRAIGREGINRGQSSNTWKQQQLDYIFF